MVKGLNGLNGWLLKRGVVLMIALGIGIGLSGCGDGDKPPDYKALLKETSRYVDEMEQKNEKLLAKLDKMTKKLEGVPVEENDESRQAEIEKIMSANQVLMDEKEALAAEIATLRREIETREETTKSEANLKEANQKLTKQKEALEKEIAELRAEVKKTEKLTRKIKKLKAENKNLSKLNKETQAKMDEIRKMISGEKREKALEKHQD